ncbi:MAG: hypothetical protein CMF80_05910 [Candidatus Marinimicrobia bacterium]|nr:hypothetical protein [Candidatus Neomarinimicrobiota bacterium]
MSSYEKSRYEREEEEKNEVITRNVTFSVLTLVSFILLVFFIYYSQKIIKDFRELKILDEDGKTARIILSGIVIFLFFSFGYGLSNFPSEIFGDFSFPDPTNIVPYYETESGYTAVNFIEMSYTFILYYIITIVVIHINTNYANDEELKNTVISVIIFTICFFSFIFITFYNAAYGDNYIEETEPTDIIFISLIIIGILSFIIASLGIYNTEYKVFLPMAEFNLLYRIVLFLPCLFTYVVNYFKNELGLTSELSILILIIDFVIIALYILYKNIDFYKPKILLNEPIYLNTEEQLNKIYVQKDKSNSRYALSFWFFINNVNDRNTPRNIIKLEEQIEFKYNENENKIKINIQELTGEGSKEGEDEPPQYTTTTYSIDNIPIQKWNHIIINYDSGILDIFMNGKLIQSINSINVKNTDTKVITGEDYGLTGGICHVRYLDRELTAQEINDFYHKYKDKTPPII